MSIAQDEYGRRLAAKGSGRKYHVLANKMTGMSVCGSLACSETMLAMQVPNNARCRSNACRVLWPDYRADPREL